MVDLSDSENGGSEDFIVSDSDEDFDLPVPKVAPKKKANKPVFDSDEDMPSAASKKTKKPAPPMNFSSEALFDSLIKGSPTKEDDKLQSKPLDVHDISGKLS